MSDSLSYKLLRRPPILFPLVALFFVFMCAVEMYLFWGDTSIYKVYLLRPVVMMVYTVFWVGCCLLKKWGAVGFVTLSILQLCLILFLPEADDHFKDAVVNNFFSKYPINLGLSFLLLFYFKRMD